MYAENIWTELTCRSIRDPTVATYLLTYLLTPSLLPTSAKLNFNGLITMTTFKPTRNERLLEFTPGRHIWGN